ncbi:MAG: monofunctional biosynthetic peptidoglycan transglycosylase, partial [Saprospiraceae bacterium]
MAIIKRWAIRIVVGFFALSILSTIVFRFLPIPITPLMIYRSLGQVFHGEPIKMKKDWVPLEKISRNLQLAVICSEDQNFAEHAGFDWKAIDKAMSENEKRVKRGKTIRGASTISQQCAKNVFLTPNRTWIRKIFEVYFTVLIETLWSKERILEVYLNVIEMGKGIYGSEAA